MDNCYQGTNVPDPIAAPCGGEYISTDCVAVPNAIPALDISAGATQTQVNSAITNALLAKEEQIEALSEVATSGTFNPNLLNGVNVSGVLDYSEAVYTKIGNIVTVTVGFESIKATSANTPTVFSMDLPIVKSFALPIARGSGTLKNIITPSAIHSVNVATSSVSKADISFYPTQAGTDYIGSITFQYSV